MTVEVVGTEVLAMVVVGSTVELVASAVEVVPTVEVTSTVVELGSTVVVGSVVVVGTVVVVAIELVEVVVAGLYTVVKSCVISPVTVPLLEVGVKS